METNQIKLGSILSYVTILLNILIGILFTPFILRSLGQSEYGLYQLIGAFVGYIAILDLGLGSTIIRYVAKYRAQNDVEKQENFLALCLIMYAVISVFVIIIGAILYMNLQNIFGSSLSTIEMDSARIMFAILVINLVISLPLNSFQAVIHGHERFVFPRMLGIIRILLRTVLLVFLLLSGYKAVSIVVVDTILNIVLMAVKIIYVFYVLKVRIRLYSFDIPFLKEIFVYTLFVFFGMAADQLYWRIGQLILGIMESTAVVAVYAIGMRLISYYMMFSTAVSKIFLPRVTQMAVRNATGEEMTNLLIRIGRIQFCILGVIISGFILFGKHFVDLWVGPEYFGSFVIAVIIMVPLTVPLMQNIGVSILQAKNMHAFRSIMYIIITIANLFISILLTRKYGIIGTAFGTAISMIAGNIIAINLYFHLKVGLNIPRFFKETLKGILTVMFSSSVFGIILLYVLPGISWGMLSIRIILFTTVYGILLWLFGLNPYERNLIRAPFIRIKNMI